MRKSNALSPEVTGKLVPLLADGTGQREIAKILNDEGLTTPSGMPWSQSFVSQYGKKLGYRRVAKFKKGKNGRRYLVAAKGEPSVATVIDNTVDDLVVARYVMQAKSIPADIRTRILELVLR